MKVDLKKISMNVGAVLGFLALFGVSGGFLTGNVQGMWNAPKKIEVLEEQILILLEENRHLSHFKEQMWEFGKEMTDNNDKELWFYGSHGKEYPVDIRNTNEKVELGFVDYIYLIYKVNYDRDSIRHFLLHDPNEHGKNRVDLYKNE